MARDLRSEVEAFLAVVRALPPDQLRPAPWGAREVLAHLAYWHGRYVELLRDGLSGRPSHLPRTTLKEQNAAAAGEARELTIGELAGRLLRAQAELDRLEADHRLNDVSIRFKEGAKARPWSELRALVAGHVHDHAAELRKRGAAGAARPSGTRESSLVGV